MEKEHESDTSSEQAEPHIYEESEMKSYSELLASQLTGKMKTCPFNMASSSKFGFGTSDKAPMSDSLFEPVKKPEKQDL